MIDRLIRAGIAFFIICATVPVATAAGTDKSTNASIDDAIDASEADDAGPSKSERSKWNEYDGKLFTLRLGGGLLIDTASYVQDADSKKQMSLHSAIDLRDFRVLLKGAFKFAPRLSYSIGYMYDAPNDVWRFRQTGIMIDVPEASGNFFVGRTKEGFSTNKLMVGYNGWANERAAANDAFLPILADGVKWTGNGFGNKLVYNIGWFTNALASVQQTYVKNDRQVAARAVWLPYAKTDSKNLLHLALEGRHGSALKGNFQFRSKPESFPAQSYAVDTGKFPASYSNMLGIEAYYRREALMFGSEYFLNKVSSQQTNDPFFHGGEIFAAYLLTGEIRRYNERGAFFESILPSRPVFKGGSGAWELVFRMSYADLDSGLIEGGRFWRATPMANWYLADYMRLEFVYGYSVLDRFAVLGGTQYFQTRLQLQLL